MTSNLHIGLFLFLAIFLTGCSPKTTSGGEIEEVDAPVEEEVDEPIGGNDSRATVVTAATNVPVFVGYTQKNPTDGDGDIIDKPIKISSVAEYETNFGSAAGPEGPFYLHPSVVLFFANGGKSCYVYSVGVYFDVVEPSAMRTAFAASGVLEKQVDITLVSVPDAVKLSPENTYAVYQDVLAHCARTTSRFAIFDLHRPTAGESVEATISAFREGIGAENLQYGSAYFPWVVRARDTLPATGAVTGAYVTNDDQRGVWKAVANLPVKGIEALSIPISSEQQGDLNVPTDGKSISALRFFPGQGNLIWGARTLDGNSLEWRYSNVVRTEIMIRTSMKKMLTRFVFEPNTQNTWTKIKAGTETWLNELWRQGAFAGATANDSYSVGVGLGETMTSVDILDGRLVVSVRVALVRPAEFTVLTYTQILAKN